MDKKKLGLTLEVLGSVSTKYLEAAQCIEENMKEACEREKLSVEELFYFVVSCLNDGCQYVMFACF